MISRFGFVLYFHFNTFNPIAYHSIIHVNNHIFVNASFIPSVKNSTPHILLLLILIGSVNFLTEITSNLATTAMLLPVLVSLATAIDINPFLLLVGATLAASYAFMLPVATPPNAVVFGSGYLKVEDMVKKGGWMNIISIILLTLIFYFILPIAWELN